MKFINFKNIIFIILFTSYHFYIHNGLEKFFSQTNFDYDSVKRPLSSCSDQNNSQRLRCIGMPSGHAETAAVFSFLLYFNKFIPLWVCLLFIYIISIQRITSHMHTLNQVVVGAILGFLYALIYKKFNLSLFSFLIVFSIGLILVLLSI